MEEEVHLEKNKCKKLNLPKKDFKLLCKIYIMEKSLKWITQEQGAVKNVVVKEDKMFKNVKHVKVEVKLFKCIKWVQECINKFKNTVINVLDKDKLFLKVENVKFVMVEKSHKKSKNFKFLYKKVLLIIIQLLWQDKETKFQMP